MTSTPAPIRVEDHVRLLRMLVKRHRYADVARASGGAIDADDLFQAGVIGLLRSAETFDPELGSWSTYASINARRHMLRHIQNLGATVRVPVHRQAARRKRGETQVHRAVSLDAPVRRRDGALSSNLTGLDLLADEATPPPDAMIERRDAETQVARILARVDLDERESFIVERRLMAADPVTLKEIGDKFELTKERARQIETRTLEKLRAAAGAAA